MKRSPIRRKTPLRSGPMRRSRKRRSRYARRPRDTEYMLAVKRLDCSVAVDPPDPRRVTPCGGAIEADHMGYRGKGQKSHDRTCAPMCKDHHGERTAQTGCFRDLKQAELREWRDRAIARTRAAIGPCRPGAWGGDGCLAHEGFDIGPDGLCVEGRALVSSDTAGDPRGEAGRVRAEPAHISAAPTGLLPVRHLSDDGAAYPLGDVDGASSSAPSEPSPEQGPVCQPRRQTAGRVSATSSTRGELW